MYTETQQPNIILIMMDATRARRLSCYGYSRVTTPNIDEIAEESVVYEQAFSPDVWTLPVAASIFTGLMPHQHQVDFDNPFLSDKHKTLAERLANSGYETWGVSPGVWIGPSTNLSRGFSTFVEPYRLIRMGKGSRIANLINRVYAKFIFQRRDKGAEKINKAAIRWLTGEDRDRSSPFFMFLHYMEPHYPYRPPAPFDKRFLEGSDRGREAKAIRYHPLDYLAGTQLLDNQQLRLLSDLYDGELAYLDHMIGEFYRELKRRRLLENTVLILFADHGESLGDHGLVDHHFALYDTLIHVPLIVRFPRARSGKTLVGEPAETRDLFSFILQSAGIEEQSGNSLSLLNGEASRPYALSETSGAFVGSIRRRHPDVDLSHFERKLFSVRTSQYKYIEGSDYSIELYDLEKDPEESTNLAATMANSPTMQRLKAYLHTEVSLDRSLQEKVAELGEDDPVLVEHLRSLGYLD